MVLSDYRRGIKHLIASPFETFAMSSEQKCIFQCNIFLET